MVYESFNIANSSILWWSFGIAFVMGLVANKTNFCTMGAVSDYVNIGDTGRWRGWLFAIAVAIIGVIIIEKMGLISLDSNPARPNYRSSNFAWFEYILGGLLFGIGMTFGSGCGNKTLIRIGAGNIKSIFVLLIMGFFAYWMIIGFSGVTLYGLVFYDWTSFFNVAMASNQDVGSIVAGIAGTDNAVDMRLWIGSGIAILLLIYIFKSKDFFGDFDNVLGGLVVGLAVIGMWYITASANVNAFNTFDEKKEIVSIAEYVKKSNWDENYQPSDRSEKSDPIAVRPDAANIVVGPQGMTFVSPSAWLINFATGPLLKNPDKKPVSAFVNIPLMLMLGIILGSLFWALVSRSFKIEWFASFKDFLAHFFGAILMGIGGVLALGCTIGQGVTGLSTLAVGSLLAFTSIVVGCALTMKVRFYQMVYEDASFFAVLITAFVDMKLLPKKLRKLDSV